MPASADRTSDQLRRGRRLLVVVLTLAVAGCGYALAGRQNSLPADVKRIAVPMFLNQSTTPDIDRVLTEAVRAELRSHRNLTVQDEEAGADAVLKVTIAQANSEPVAFTTEHQGSRYQITIIASADLKRAKDGTVLFSNASLRQTDEFDLASGASSTSLAALYAQDQNAFDRLAKAFARSLVQSMLSNF
jgi:outer membrane lipopolysaccharide assembly protein LptE/RlpB